MDGTIARFLVSAARFVAGDKMIPEPEMLKALPPGPEVYYRTRIVSITDADTFHVEVDLGFGVTINGLLRAAGFDAWESRKVRRALGGVTDEEVVKGKAAKADIEAMLGMVDSVWIKPGRFPRDCYGRLLGEIYTITGGGELAPVATWMKERGHCRA